MDYSILTLLIAAVLGFSVAAPDERMLTPGAVDVTRTLTEHFEKGPFSVSRHPVSGAQGRSDMQIFIRRELKILQVRGEGLFNATIEEIKFNTTIMYKGEHTNVTATNLILVFPGEVNTSDDEPLMFLSNYDTDENANFINEGSGVAAMLVIAESIVAELTIKKKMLQHSLIFAFTDIAFEKYSFHHASEGITGATQVAKSWLPQYMAHRNTFTGAIILDNIMNYNGTANSQYTKDLGFDRSFEDAYKKMSDSNFAANFLALVQRDDHLDNPLAKKVEDGWRNSKKEVKAVNGSHEHGHSSQIDPLLISFAITTDTFPGTESLSHFLKSEQTAFWNHHVERAGKLYPAVTLTDTRYFRGDACRLSCDLREMTTKPKLAFAKRTIDTLISVTLQAQTDTDGASAAQTSSIIIFSSIIIAFITNKLF